jgi:hypothetical protein
MKEHEAMTSSRWLASRVGIALAALAMTGTITGTARTASADEKQACLRASEKAQHLRNAGKLGDAREQLAACSRPECPKLVQQDCTQWMSELLATLPSVVPAAKDRRGRDLVDVRVTLDGKLVTETLDGKALVVDPGVHSLRFETSGAPAVDEKVVVNPGEKNRIVTVTFAKGGDPAAPAASAGTGAAAGTASGPPRDASGSSPPVAAYVVGGLGVVALGAALLVQLGASSDARGLRETCAPKCSQSDVDDIQSRYTIAGVTAGVGGALLITGVVMLFLQRDEPRSGPSTSRAAGAASRTSSFVTFQPSPVGGAAAVVRF